MVPCYNWGEVKHASNALVCSVHLSVVEAGVTTLYLFLVHSKVSITAVQHSSGSFRELSLGLAMQAVYIYLPKPTTCAMIHCLLRSLESRSSCCAWCEGSLACAILSGWLLGQMPFISHNKLCFVSRCYTCLNRGATAANIPGACHDQHHMCRC